MQQQQTVHDKVLELVEIDPGLGKVLNVPKSTQTWQRDGYKTTTRSCCGHGIHLTPPVTTTHAGKVVLC